MSPIPPAEGERRAISGFLPQYRIAASLILKGLIDGTLCWVRITDPEAGRVDDIQVGGQARVDAYQIKWGQYPGSFTYKDFADPTPDAPGLIAQLADGWRRLRASHPGQRVVVHLVTSSLPSVNARPPSGTPPPRPAHFAAFVEQAWRPACALPLGDRRTSGPWAPTWVSLQSASGLTDEEFNAFLPDCELEFGHRIDLREAATTREQGQTQFDLVKLCQVLMETAASPERVIHLTREHLLDRLCWRSRVELRSRHDFPVDEALYQPVEETVRRLKRALDDLPGGYVGVFGSPGSGKSTLLTQTLRALPHRLVRYYAFVPDAQNSARGESENFLHDVVLELQRQGFHPGGTLNWSDRVQLMDRFGVQLRQLHEDFRRTGCTTIILVDGLDHIEREQRAPSGPCSETCPSRGRSPRVSSSSSAAKNRPAGGVARQRCNTRSGSQVASSRWRLPLARDAVLRIIARAGLADRLSGPQQERVFAISAGHPLALAYLLNRLADPGDDRGTEAVLGGAEPYRGDIEAQYHSYWRQIEGDDDLAHLIGLLARQRGAIDLGWAEGWVGSRLVDRLRRAVGHYFRREGDDRWYFFHNSFRLFLLTATSGPGPAGCRDRALHRELAGHCANAEPGSYRAWEELYHRLGAGEHRAVLDLATPEWFRGQFLAFRPVDAIKVDIRLAIRSASASRDAPALARMALVGGEVGQRESNLHDFCFASVLLRLGQERVATEHLREGNRLRTSRSEALTTCVMMEEAGLHQEARRVFELAEPLDLLSGSRAAGAITGENVKDLLRDWAKAATRFRVASDLVASVRRVRCRRETFEDTEGDAEDASDGHRPVQNWLLFHAGVTLLEQRRWDDLGTVLRAYDQDGPGDRDFVFWLRSRIWRDRVEAGDIDGAREYLEAAIAEVVNGFDPGAEGRVVLAEGVFRILGDADGARNWLQGVEQPELRTDLEYARDDLTPFRQRLGLNRLLIALGDRRPEERIVPDTDDLRWQGLVYFERGVCVIARLWGEAWRGRRLGARRGRPRVLWTPPPLPPPVS